MIVLRNLAFYPAFYLGSVGFVLAALVAIAARGRGLERIVEGWCRWHRGCARLLLGIRVRIEGPAPEGPALYAIRHESFFEAIDLPCLFDRPAPFAKSELFAIPGWGRAARAYGCVPVARDQGARALRAMVASARLFIAAGRPLAIFPEGTRVPHGQRVRLQAGFAGLYKLLGLPVVPVAVDSGPLYHRRLKRPGTITYRFADPIAPGLPRAEVEARVGDAINALNRA
ncbi:lysophospholipid acyltransferase family protein [Pelagerythrobacter marinus]|jgi:1-acyl-sn-glycerol-3-phosphate acyltransferase|uniref:1-acyl-sn-glycerol-3-phosphate acyltransferase n=1 Tax=Pelagerythrobacter marinus TaxID=538382 RepID=A0ABW9UZU9_9SPHN|nr:lysophospholipid acyltransferase family protein [Pelagerythrobacter marinus]MEC9067344.1 lysophospholipid acyltransferase family protein [Pseudomonadota bacterium]MXO69434.1 1-acyl-sn-glycerol-3-phosphate acyltransferase [Pelagerythrobacter marinus]USA39481.1 1-acyl-sn-glycerol-3-phosphate acyltransferase [Pelagerythrobacter marinus]WPZ06379.1 lysophospholipid acyltransferase family protein [Pelagerythrobacter marinus]